MYYAYLKEFQNIVQTTHRSWVFLDISFIRSLHRMVIINNIIITTTVITSGGVVIGGVIWSVRSIGIIAAATSSPTTICPATSSRSSSSCRSRHWNSVGGRCWRSSRRGVCLYPLLLLAIRSMTIGMIAEGRGQQRVPSAATTRRRRCVRRRNFVSGSGGGGGQRRSDGRPAHGVVALRPWIGLLLIVVGSRGRWGTAGRRGRRGGVRTIGATDRILR